MTGSALPPICGARTYLPTRLLPFVMRLETHRGRATEMDIERHLRCTLQAHSDGDHWGLVLELYGIETGSVWAPWTTGINTAAPEKLVVLPDCSVSGPAGEACGEYDRHPGGHTWQIHDPLDNVRTLIGGAPDALWD
jgi:hypothetical protein